MFVGVDPPRPVKVAGSPGAARASSQRPSSAAQLVGRSQKFCCERVVCMCVQEKRCVVSCVAVVQSGQSGEGYVEGLIL